jgi:hypothetical protein
MTMTAVLTNVTAPLAREWAKARGVEVGKGKADTRKAVLTFLHDNPATLRALAKNLGITEGLGSRGRIADSVYDAVTDSVLGIEPTPEVTGA